MEIVTAILLKIKPKYDKSVYKKTNNFSLNVCFWNIWKPNKYPDNIQHISSVGRWLEREAIQNAKTVLNNLNKVAQWS